MSRFISLDDLIQFIQEAFDSLSYVGLYQTQLKEKRTYSNKADWDEEVVLNLLDKPILQSDGFQQFKVDFGDAGFWLIYKLNPAIWLILSSEERIYPQVNLFLRQVEVENFEWVELLQSSDKKSATVIDKKSTEKKKSLDVSNDPFMQKLYAAKRIQHSLLPKEDDFNKIFPRNVIFYQPQEVIGGDIYWIREVGEEVVLLVADCTGHSVEGALASMTVHSLLNEMLVPGKSLKEVATSFFTKLEEYGHSEDHYSVGVELAIVKLNPASNKISYITTGVPIFIEKSGQIEQIRVRTRFGSSENVMEGAVSVEDLQLNKEDKLFIFTDGLIDQFDRKNAKKLGMKGVSRIIEKICQKGSFSQSVFDDELAKFRGDTEQIDDITLVAIEI